MKVEELTLMIGTAQPEALSRFYGEVLGLKPDPEYRNTVLRAAGANIRILRHSEITGAVVEPARMQINLFVSDVRGEWKRLAGLGVHFVREPEVESWGGVVATMVDPDGNYVQLVEFQTAGSS